MSRFRDRRRLKQKLESAPVVWIAGHLTPKEPVSWLEKWLPRLGHAAQFGLLAVTIAALFFTVVPIYQRDVLEESIAQKQSELREAQAAVERTYASVRSYAVHGYTFAAAGRCTGLLIPPDIRVKRDTHAEILGIDVAACLKDQLAKSNALEELRTEDYERLAEEVSKIGATIEALRREARSAYESFAERAKRDPSIVGAPGEFGEELLSIVPPGEREAMRADLAFSRSRERVVESYAEDARERIRALNSMEWRDFR